MHSLDRLSRDESQVHTDTALPALAAIRNGIPAFSGSMAGATAQRRPAITQHIRNAHCCYLVLRYLEIALKTS